jgi:hypothetical protein
MVMASSVGCSPTCTESIALGAGDDLSALMHSAEVHLIPKAVAMSLGEVMNCGNDLILRLYDISSGTSSWTP